MYVYTYIYIYTYYYNKSQGNLVKSIIQNIYELGA